MSIHDEMYHPPHEQFVSPLELQLLELEEEIFEWIEAEVKENDEEYFSFENREELYEEFCYIINELFDFPTSFVYQFVRQRIDFFFQEFYVEGTIKHLQEINSTLPKQRTEEWYIYRHNLLTASNVYKIFGSSAQFNSLILEKCQDISATSHFTSSSCDWGKTYEPLSVLFYEKTYDTKVQEFGCFQHRKWKCLGASPDGIVVGNRRYGRMLEIKNIVNRDITGVPLPHYWIQMQIQMEVCDLDICDFLETRFKECMDVKEWMLLSGDKWKGCITVNNEGDKIYHIWDAEKISIADFVSIHSSDTLAVYTRWWYLDEWSCIKVLRDRHWFQNALPKILDFWEIILKERIDGFEHRRPKPRSTTKGVLFLY